MHRTGAGHLRLSLLRLQQGPSSEVGTVTAFDGDSWNPYDKNRTCYSCGAPPDARYPDGSPSYTLCHHEPVVASEQELERWGPAPERKYRKVKGQ